MPFVDFLILFTAIYALTRGLLELLLYAIRKPVK